MHIFIMLGTIGIYEDFTNGQTPSRLTYNFDLFVAVNILHTQI